MAAMKITPAEKQAFIESMRREIDGMYNVFYEQINTYWADISGPPPPPLTLRQNLHYRWRRLTYRVAAAVARLAMWINPRAVDVYRDDE